MKMLNVMVVGVLTVMSMNALADNFSDFDLNQDGFISQSEAAISDTLTSQFMSLDTNKDGKLSKSEFAH
ncbi:EF-hand domain-containing protein [Pseudoalteromonas sp. MMG012]|uniref:EF-hand domain-containing protein n=1 Tax=Pseudoalteromonas sp. MMG012 TaxID=2822686 RepID=UPI001B3A545E|nr:EF-hand domain-containing protein [Pseudoalteromonas sp. MMG012]MBQ4850213.1 EF-hand domain-containing protein [Pseudoalteromonas sp. MMG012]